MKLDDYYRLAPEVGLAPQYRGGAITVHGMMSSGGWQKDVNTCLQDAMIRHTPVHYGFVTVGALDPRKRNLIAEKILAAYEDQLPHCKHGSPAVVAHSLGTLGLGRAFELYEELKLSRAILYGSILRREFPWAALHADGRIEAVMNEAASNDFPVFLAPYALRHCGAGASGREGFLDGGGVVTNRQHGHTGHGGLQYPLHYRDIWRPFLLKGWGFDAQLGC